MDDAALIAKLLWCAWNLRRGRPEACMTAILDVAEALRDRIGADVEIPAEDSTIDCGPLQDERYVWDEPFSRSDW